MNYKKLSVSLFLSFLLLFSTAFSSVSAKENSNETDTQTTNEEYQIDSVESLKEKVVQINKNQEQIGDEATYKNLVENTEPEVLEEYTQQLEDDISNAINQVTEEGVILDTDGNDVITNTVELPDGGFVKIEQTLVVEEQPTDIQPLAADYIYPMGTKTYYEAKVVIYHALYPDTKLVLKTGFSINSKGIKAEYASTAGTSAFFPNTVTHSSQITDSTGYVVGQDINAQGDYSYAAVGMNGTGLFQSSHSIISTVKLLKLTSSGATVRVSFQHLT